MRGVLCKRGRGLFTGCFRERCVVLGGVCEGGGVWGRREGLLTGESLGEGGGGGSGVMGGGEGGGRGGRRLRAGAGGWWRWW